MSRPGEQFLDRKKEAFVKINYLLQKIGSKNMGNRKPSDLCRLTTVAAKTPLDQLAAVQARYTFLFHNVITFQIRGIIQYAILWLVLVFSF